MHRTFLYATAACMLWSWPAGSSAQGRWEAFPDAGALVFSGEIDRRSAAEFDLLLARYPQTELIALDSPGGLVIPALEIAEKIDQRAIDTVILDDSKCYSACSLMFMAGAARNAEGKLGVHQISGTDDVSVTQFAVAKIYDKLLSFGAERDFFNRMFETTSDQMYVFSADEVEQLAINRSSKKISDTGLDDEDAPVEFDVVASNTNGAWEAKLFRNYDSGHYFCALQSVQTAPLIGLVSYLTKDDAFVEILDIPITLTVGPERLDLTYFSKKEAPLTISPAAMVEDAHTMWFNINSEEQGAAVLAPLAVFHHLKIETDDGRLVALYDLTGSLKSALIFSNCIQNGL